jgi:hypothetical protein
MLPQYVYHRPDSQCVGKSTELKVVLRILEAGPKAPQRDDKAFALLDAIVEAECSKIGAAVIKTDTEGRSSRRALI